MILLVAHRLSRLKSKQSYYLKHYEYRLENGDGTGNFAVLNSQLIFIHNVHAKLDLRHKSISVNHQ